MSQANYLMNCASSWPMRAKNSPVARRLCRLLRTTPTKAAARRHGAKHIVRYFEDEPGRRSVAKLLSKDEARRIAANIAKPLEVLTLTLFFGL
jgi:TnpA family transposase